eukprot:m.58914 g.58914  ORF g.58914 m.58914 type:complete len:547 (+) comp12214_c0_seq1:992-2632(+)
MGAEVEASKDAGLVAGAEERAAHDDVVQTIKAGQAKVVVVRVDAEAGQRREVVLAPLPDVAKHIVKTGRGGRQGIDGRLAGVREVEVVAALEHLGSATAVHDRVAARANGEIVVRGIADAVVLELGEDAQGVGGVAGNTVLLVAPVGKGLGLVVVDNDGPVPRHVNDVKERAQAVLVQTRRAGGHPELRPLGVAEETPRPALGRPVLLLRVALAAHKLEVLAVGDFKLVGGKGSHGDLLLTVFVVPAKGGPAAGLAQGDVAGIDVDPFILGVVHAFLGVGHVLDGVGRGVVGREVLGALDEVDWKLANKHRAGLDMDALVLKAKHHGPELALVQVADGIKFGVLVDARRNRLVDLLTILSAFFNRRPLHVILAHVVPAHFIDSRLKDALKVRVDLPGNQAGHAELVDVHRCWVCVVEDLGVTQVVVWRAEKRIRVFQRAKEDLGGGPHIVKRIQHILARCLGHIHQRCRVQRPVAEARCLRRCLASPLDQMTHRSNSTHTQLEQRIASTLEKVHRKRHVFKEARLRESASSWPWWQPDATCQAPPS